MCWKIVKKKWSDSETKDSIFLSVFAIIRLNFIVSWWTAMRDFCVNNNTKMAELKFEAPLAQFEETDEWGPVDFQSSLPPQTQSNPMDSLNYLNNLKENLLLDNNNLNNNNIDTIDSLKLTSNINNNNINKLLMKDHVDNFNDSSFSGSLEDLVNNFDEKITKCFGNYEQSVEELAPVQVRSQEEIMNECQWVSA